MNYPHDQIGNSQTDKADYQELCIFRGNVGVLAFKSPCAVKKVIRRSRHRKSNGISYILMDLKPFLAYIGGPEIDKNAGESNDAEFDELNQESPRKVFGHTTIV